MTAAADDRSATDATEADRTTGDKVRWFLTESVRMFAVFWAAHLAANFVAGVLAAMSGVENPLLLIFGFPIGMAYLDVVLFSPAIVLSVWVARSVLGRPWQVVALVAAAFSSPVIAFAVTGRDPVTWLPFLVSQLLTWEWLRRRRDVP